MCYVHMRMCVYIGYMWYTGVEHMYTACIVIGVVHCSGIFLSLFLVYCCIDCSASV